MYWFYNTSIKLTLSHKVSMQNTASADHIHASRGHSAIKVQLKTAFDVSKILYHFTEMHTSHISRLQSIMQWSKCQIIKKTMKLKWLLCCQLYRTVKLLQRIIQYTTISKRPDIQQKAQQHGFVNFPNKQQPTWANETTTSTLSCHLRGLFVYACRGWGQVPDIFLENLQGLLFEIRSSWSQNQSANKQQQQQTRIGPVNFIQIPSQLFQPADTNA